MMNLSIVLNLPFRISAQRYTIFDPSFPLTIVFYDYLQQILMKFDPSPLQITDVLNGWSLYLLLLKNLNHMIFQE